MKRAILAWIAAVLTTAVLGSIFQTQNVLARLSGVGADISVVDRIGMTGYDLFYFAKVLGIFVSVALLVAFLAGALLIRLSGLNRAVVYAGAGAVAMAVMLYLMKNAFFGVQLVAGARDSIGFAFILIAGALGGLVFARLSRRRAVRF